MCMCSSTSVVISVSNACDRYIATGLMHMDLQQLLRQEGSLEDRLTQVFLYQIMVSADLEALYFLTNCL